MTSSSLTVDQLRRKTTQDLEKMATTVKEQIREKQFDVRTAQLKKNHTLSQLKKSLAKILTIHNEINSNVKKDETDKN